jgi:FtsH-binding integral membrane protein
MSTSTPNGSDTRRARGVAFALAFASIALSALPWILSPLAQRAFRQGDVDAEIVLTFFLFMAVICASSLGIVLVKFALSRDRRVWPLGLATCIVMASYLGYEAVLQSSGGIAFICLFVTACYLIVLWLGRHQATRTQTPVSKNQI